MARQQVGASSRARALPVPSPSRSPRAASPPRRARAASCPRAGSVAVSQSRTLRGAPATAVASAAALQPGGSASAPQRRGPGHLSLLRRSPFLSRPSFPHCPRREPGYEAGGRAKGVGKMEVPRLDHALNSPTSPCEEVIKNLSLEAIQLCDRDGKSGRDGEDWRRWGKARCQTPRPLGLPPTLLAKAVGSFVVPLVQLNAGWGLPFAHPLSPQTPETKGPRGSRAGWGSRRGPRPRGPSPSSPALLPPRRAGEGAVPAGVSGSGLGVWDLCRSPAFLGFRAEALRMFPALPPAPRAHSLAVSAQKLTSSFLNLPSSDLLHFEVFLSFQNGI